MATEPRPTVIDVIDVVRAALVLTLFTATILSTVAWARSRLPASVAVPSAPLLLAAVWAMTLEGLSATVGISPTAITSAAAVLGIAAISASAIRPQGWKALATDSRTAWRGFVSLLKVRSWWRWPLLFAIALAALTILASLLVALIGAPNNGDSLGYHLPRVMWWLQEGQLGPYVSPDVSQSTYPPLAGYLLLVVHGASGSDLLVNLVQWTAGIFAVASLGLIAWLITRSSLVVVMALIFASTIPTGITQLTTTQSDWVAALWPLLALVLVIARARQRLPLLPYIVLLASAAALTFATKPTAALATGLVIFLAMWWEIRPPEQGSLRASIPGWVRAVIVAAAFMMGSLLGGLPQVLRNMQWTGSPLGIKTDIFVEQPSLEIMWANSIRTLVNNVGIPRPLSDPINENLERVLAWIGVPMSDPDAIHLSNVLTVGLGRNEDLTTNPVHMLLGLVLAVVLLFMPGLPRMMKPIIVIGIAFFTFSNGILQWQEWSTRFFLPAMVLFSLPLAWLTAHWLNLSRARIMVRGLTALALLLATAAYGFAVSVAQEYRPLIGATSILTTPRVDQYFRVVNRPGAPDTPQSVLTRRLEALSTLPEGSRIGLYRFFGQEYVVWRLLNPDGRYTFVNMQNLEGETVVDAESVDGTICERECPEAAN